MWANTIYELAGPYNATINVCVKMIANGYNEHSGNNVACDMPGQIPYMSWLILIMPLSMLMLNCAISFGKGRAGELFYNDRSAQC